MRSIAIVGLSGVGKSSLIGSIKSRLPFLHLEASQLLKQEFDHRSIGNPTSEELRLGAVLNNQELLMQSFSRATRDYNGLVIFDGHALVDGIDGIVEIPEAIFRELRVGKFVFVQDMPDNIVERRISDKFRSRPKREIADIAEQQWHALRIIAGYSMSMRVPILVIGPDDEENLVNFLSS